MKQLLLILLLIPVTTAYTLDEAGYLLKGESINETFDNIQHYINADYTYEFNWRSLGIDYTFDYRIGDCTDYSELAVYFLNLNDIDARTVHGYATCNNKRVRHDWVVMNKTDYDIMECTDFSARRLGVW